MGSHPSASLAKVGFVVFKSLIPGTTLLFPQIGQLFFCIEREYGDACHVCPAEHFQLIFFKDPDQTDLAMALVVSFAKSGLVVAKSLNPGRIILLMHTGHFALRPAVRRFGEHSQICPS